MGSIWGILCGMLRVKTCAPFFKMRWSVWVVLPPSTKSNLSYVLDQDSYSDTQETYYIALCTLTTNIN